MKVVYTGSSDFQEFDANDFKKAEVENQKKIRFAKGEPTEVSEEAGQALTASSGIFGGHSFEVAPDEDQKVDEEADSGNLNEMQLADEGEEATTDSTASPSPAPSTKTGRGSSTRSKA